MTPTIRFTIRSKLVVLIGGLLTGVIAFLGTYQTTHEITALSEDLARKASAYGTLVSRQVTSAVAFTDRATAVEVLGSLETDPDVVGIVLYGDANAVLYSHGTPSAWASNIGDLGTTTRVVRSAGRISAITPVRPLEGPHGKLVIQLSTESLDRAEARAIRTAGIVGGLAFLFGLTAAWWIAGKFARRLRKIADVAVAVAGGELEVGAIADNTGDEIGMVARTFDGMVGQLRHLMARQRHNAKRERERLEDLVVARTVQLDRRNAEMRLIFDHVEQGLLTVDVDGTIASEHSDAVVRMLGAIPESGKFVDYVRTFAPLAADWIEMSWTSLADGSLPVELCLAQLPSRFTVAGRCIVASYKPLTAEDRVRVLVVFSDETAVIERESAERDERETTALVSRLLHDRTGFTAFCAETDRHVEDLGQDRDLARTVHTLKGIASIERISSIAGLCHDLESALAEDDAEGVGECRKAIVARWALLRTKVAPLLDLATERLDLSFSDLDRLELAIARRASYDELEEQIAAWRHDRVLPRLERYADQARILASRLCKDPVEVRVEVDADMRVPSGRFRGFWSTFVHPLRNAIDHGIETTAERTAAGKSDVATIILRAHRTGNDTVVELEDRGRGIDWARVADRARGAGLPCDTHEDLVEALSHDGLSTRDEVSDVSGRGVGFGAFRQACLVSGGRLAVTSAPGRGTKITVTWSGARTILQMAG